MIDRLWLRAEAMIWWARWEGWWRREGLWLGHLAYQEIWRWELMGPRGHQGSPRVRTLLPHRDELVGLDPGADE